ncbi:MAG: biosynthetic-type acetolactate synthase large subunit, partial [Anaerovorax sp.]
FATSGPGATNTVTGIATAYMDSSPMVIITGQVPISLLGKDSFQEVDIVGVALPITKHSFFCRTVDEIAVSIRKAFKIAMSGRPGPVLVDVPKNLMLELGEYVVTACQQADPLESVDAHLAKEIAEEINEAKRPVMIAGGGVVISEACKELSDLAEKANIPVITTLMSLGSFDRRNPLSLGMLGMHGEKEANLATHNSDLIIAIGTRFSDRVIGDASRFAKGAKIIHIDIDPAEIGKNMRFDISMKSDVKMALEAILPNVHEATRGEWLEKVESYKQKDQRKQEKLDPESMICVLNRMLGEDVIVATDVGQHQMWTAQKWMFRKPRTFITSGGLGTMGFGLGAAIGAQIGNPGKQVVLITGDGSFRMNCNELATVAAQNLPIIVVVVKNHTLGMVRQWQKLFFDKRYSSTDLPDVIDYEKLADAFGLTGNGYLVRDIKALETAVEKAKASGKGSVIACEIFVDENVWPIVPPGEAINNQVVSEEA